MCNPASSVALNCALILAGLVAAGPHPAAAQTQGGASQDLASAVATAGAGPPARFQYNNRRITELRATVFSRPPAERAAVAADLLDAMIDAGLPGPVSMRATEGAAIVSVGNRDIFAIFPADVNPLTGETQESKAADAAARLQQAIDEAVELRTPGRMARAGALALGATLVALALLWQLARLYRVFSVRIPSRAERRLRRSSPGHILAGAVHAADVLRYAIAALFVGTVLFIVYSWLTFVLRRFPYTRPWGESLRAFLIERTSSLALQFASALPDLFTVAIIVLGVRVAVRLVQAVFQAVEDGRIAVPYLYPETAAPTRRLVTALLWLFAIVVAYPYLPGSGSDAFKGVSVFVGLVVSLGSSGIVNQMMSGLTLTYSRAVRLGDYVRIGEVEGTVTQLGALSTKVRTPRGEEVTIPNGVVVEQVTTNYSRLAATEGVYVPTTVTIGYDTPWRQIHALLLMAAGRTAGIRAEPVPVVRQTALKDSYVEYTLLVCLEKPELRVSVLDALHANIQDTFSEYGVQIMSPNYEGDPEAPKVVRPDQWYAAPAGPPVAATSASRSPAGRS
jgi:small-conductance mechanosensitive channel